MEQNLIGVRVVLIVIGWTNKGEEVELDIPGWERNPTRDGGCIVNYSRERCREMLFQCLFYVVRIEGILITYILDATGLELNHSNIPTISFLFSELVADLLSLTLPLVLE